MYLCAVKLSIIIPVYGVETTLDCCVESIRNQDFSDFEMILIDDGSPDRCPQLCDEWNARDSRIRVVHQPNGGLSTARNRGIDMARGELITFIDSDDHIAPGTFSAIVEQMDSCDVLEYPVFCHFGSNHQELLSFGDKVYEDAGNYWLQTHAYQHTYACNKVYRRWLFDSVRFPEGRVFEDAYTLPRILSQHPRIATTSRGCYYYCWNQHGITAKANGEQLSMLLDAHLGNGMPMDDEYYIHLLNIQMDVYNLTGQQPRLPYRRIRKPLALSDTKLKLKAIIQNFIGIKMICKINKIKNSIGR